MISKETLERIAKRIEEVKASHDGCGKVEIEIVKGKVTHIRTGKVEAITE